MNDLKQISGPSFFQYLQPVIDALIKLGGSGRPGEVKELVADDLQLVDEVLEEWGWNLFLKRDFTCFGLI